MKAKRRNPAVSTWGSSGYIVVLPKGEVMPDETTKPVAAPLEGTPTAKEFWLRGKLVYENQFKFAEAYAAAVSKNCCGDAHMQLEAAMAMIEACGFAKQTVGNVTTWHNRRAEKAEARISELERERNRVADLVEEAIANFPRCKWSERAERVLAEIRSKP